MTEPESATRRDHTADMSTAERPPRRTALWITAAVVALAARKGIEMPISTQVAALAEGRRGVEEAVEALLARPLKEE